MTSTVNDATAALLESGRLGTLASAIDVVAIVLLALLLVADETGRAYAGRRRWKTSSVLELGIRPLAVAFAGIMIARTIEIV